jgi:hypothetical protein
LTDGHSQFDLDTDLIGLHVYDYIRKLCKQQAEVVQNHENEHIRNIGQGKASHGKYESLELDSDKAYDCSSD